MQIKLTIPDDIYTIIKEEADKDLRKINQEIIYMLRKYIETIARPGVTPTPVEQIMQQPLIYIPTPENPTSAPVFTNSITTPTPAPDTSQMTKIEQAEYAKELLNQAEITYAKELKQLEITKKENTELLKQLYAEEKQAQKQEARAQAKTLTPEEQELQKQKLELQKQKMQEKRDSLIKDKAIELELNDAEDYNEHRLLLEYFGISDVSNANFDEEHYGKPNPYKNKPLDELYKYMNELKQYEIKEREEEDRRDALPHDKDDYDYKSEDFIKDVTRLQNVWIERGDSDTSYDDEDYNILFNYFFKKGLYHDFEQRMNHPYYAFSDDDIQDLQNAFNRDKIDISYVNALMRGDGYRYREMNKCKSYFEEHQEERAEWQRIIDESKKKKTEII